MTSECSSSKPQLLGVRGQKGVLEDIHDSEMFLVQPGSRHARECMHVSRLDLPSTGLGVCELVWARWSDRWKQKEAAIGKKDHGIQAHTAWVQNLAADCRQRRGLPLRLVETTGTISLLAQGFLPSTQLRPH